MNLVQQFNCIIYIHSRQHWRFWIEEFGAPPYYSTMHWESKHKQLKIIKETRTNNTNHEKDIILKAMSLQVHHLRLYHAHTTQNVCCIYVLMCLTSICFTGFMYCFPLSQSNSSDST